MENELVQPAGNDDDNFSLINLNSTTEKINKTVSKIKDDYIYIGFLLWEVREYKFYLSKGYESVVEYAEKELNFKKTSTYNFISVCEKFSKRHDNGNPTMNLDSKYKDFSFSQLVEIKTLPIEQLESFDSDMSKRDIREKKKELKNDESNIIDVEFKQDQADLIDNQTVICVDPVSVVENKDNISLKQVDSIIENNISKDNIKLFEEEKNNQSCDIQNLKKENSEIKKEEHIEFIPTIEAHEKDIFDYLNDRLEVLRSLAKGLEKDSDDRIKYLAGAYEVELLIDFINKEGGKLFLD